VKEEGKSKKVKGKREERASPAPPSSTFAFYLFTFAFFL
jgi:hypothetical protein